MPNYAPTPEGERKRLLAKSNRVIRKNRALKAEVGSLQIELDDVHIDLVRSEAERVRLKNKSNRVIRRLRATRA